MVKFNFKYPILFSLFTLILVFRCWSILELKNPLDTIFSDTSRHYDNAKNFWTPGPMGTGNPFLYQFYLHYVLRFTLESKIGIGVITCFLSILFSLGWLFAAYEILGNKKRALLTASLISIIPSTFFCYSFFLNETLLMSLMGFALGFSIRSIRTKNTIDHLLSVFLWCLAALTRPVVIPIAMILFLFDLLNSNKKILNFFSTIFIWVILCIYPAIRSYEHYGKYSPFGNDARLTEIYFFSGMLGYQVTFKYGAEDRPVYYYTFGSPSYYSQVLSPLSTWQTSRKDTFNFEINPKNHGADTQKILYEQIIKNFNLLPSFIFENLIYLWFGYSWPISGIDTGIKAFGYLAMNERWIWFPIFTFIFIRNLRRIVNRSSSKFDLATLLYIFLLSCAHLGPMEGRYRMPIQPLLLISLFTKPLKQKDMDTTSFVILDA